MKRILTTLILTIVMASGLMAQNKETNKSGWSFTAGVDCKILWADYENAPKYGFASTIEYNFGRWHAGIGFDSGTKEKSMVCYEVYTSIKAGYEIPLKRIVFVPTIQTGWYFDIYDKGQQKKDYWMTGIGSDIKFEISKDFYLMTKLQALITGNGKLGASVSTGLAVNFH